MTTPLPVVRFDLEEPTTSPSGAEVLGELLGELDAALASVGFPVDSALAPGVPRATIRRRFDDAALHAPEELVAWWSWHNGQPVGAPRAISGWEFSTIDVIDHRGMGLELGSDGEDGTWNRTWVPLTNEALVLAVDTSGSDSPRVRVIDPGPWDTHGPTSPTQVRSLTTPVTWWLEAIRDRTLIWNREAWCWDHDNVRIDPMPRMLGYL